METLSVVSAIISIVGFFVSIVTFFLSVNINKKVKKKDGILQKLESVEQKLQNTDEQFDAFLMLGGILGQMYRLKLWRGMDFWHIYQLKYNLDAVLSKDMQFTDNIVAIR